MLNPELRTGRAAPANARSARFDDPAREADGDWLDARGDLDGAPPLRTEVSLETPRTIITRNASPDIGFDRSINAYRGCEHVMRSKATASPHKEKRASLIRPSC